MKASLVLVLSLLITVAHGEPLAVGDFQLTLGKGFTELPRDTEGRLVVRTPASSPVTVVPLALGSLQNWEPVALDYLLSEYRKADPRILADETPQEISIKREGRWTTLYWTFGGTKSYFGMYWGGRTPGEGALLFWACPTKASGRSQYQALSEITKGISVGPG